MTLQDFITLRRLSRQRLTSEPAYRDFQAFQAQLLLRYLRQHGVEIVDQQVLDLGSGIGGYSDELARQGAQVISIDLMSAAVTTVANCYPVVGNAQAIPVRDGGADVVFCASLIEHVPQPAQVIAEIERVLKPGGYCYLSFPPFYSPMGGHEYAPWHYLGERLSLRLSTRRRQRIYPAWVQRLYQVNQDPTSFAATYQDWGLYTMTIAKARRLLAVSGLRQIDLSTRYLPINPARWPVIGELLTWHVQFLLQKP